MLPLMVDEGRIARLLRGISDRSARLHAAAATRDEIHDPLWLDGVKYLFVTIIEGCVDVAHHLAASEKWQPPDSNAAALRAMGERGVIDAELATHLASAVGFRNVLVHQYAAVDDRIVMSVLDRIDEFDRFVAATSAWVLRREHGAGDR